MTTERVGTSAGCFLVYERITKTGYMNHKSKTEIGEDIDEECTIQPDGCGEEEIKEIAEAVNSGWITTGPKTKRFENEIVQYCHTNKAVCLNSATACLESILRLLGIGPGERWTMTGKCVVRLRILPDVLFMWSTSWRRKRGKAIVRNQQKWRLRMVICSPVFV